MKRHLLALILVCGNALAMDKMPFTEADAVKEISSGHCGQGVIGSFPIRGPGWLVQPIPGPVKVCMTGNGTIQTNGMRTQGIAAQHCVTIDMDAGRPYYVIVNSTDPHERMTWKVPGYLEGFVPIGFQLPAAQAY